MQVCEPLVCLILGLYGLGRVWGCLPHLCEFIEQGCGVHGRGL